MANLREILANNLKKHRKICGFSQSKLAEKAEISTQYIAMIELYRQFPTPEVLDKIAGAFGIEAYELFAVPASPESAIERLHQDIRNDMKKMFEEFLNKI